jgi:hypothetical protein
MGDHSAMQSAAHAMWGATYDAIPKSVFALAAWSMAATLAGECDEGDVEARVAHEIQTLVEGRHLPAKVAHLALKHLPAPKDDVGADYSEGGYVAGLIADAAAAAWRDAGDAWEARRVEASRMPQSDAKRAAYEVLNRDFKHIDALVRTWLAAKRHAATFP